MGVMMRKATVFAVFLLQLLLTTEYTRVHGLDTTNGFKHRRINLTTRSLAAAAADPDTNILRAELLHRDHAQSTLSASSAQKPVYERFLEAVKRSNTRLTHMEERMRQSTVAAQKSVSLQSPLSAGSGEYVMIFSLGTPPQQFSTIADTGSDLIWLQCLPCTSCFTQTGPKFDPTKSSTYRRAGCSDALCTDLAPQESCSSSGTCLYTYGYGDGSSTRGDLAFDTVTLDNSVGHIAIGCGHNNQGSFAGAGGLVGLGQGPLSLPSQLSPSVAKIFSYCLVSLSAAATASSPIIFGNAAANSGATYTPLIVNTVLPTYYYVGVTGISVGGQRVTIPASAFQIDASGNGGVILDSGTTITYWTEAAYTPIRAAFEKQISYPTADGTPYGLDLCYDISSAGSSAVNFPDMVIHFTNADFEVPVDNLFLEVDPNGPIACLAMSSSSQFSIIGNIQQQNHLVVYDLVRKRVGFEYVQC